MASEDQWLGSKSSLSYSDSRLTGSDVHRVLRPVTQSLETDFVVTIDSDTSLGCRLSAAESRLATEARLVIQLCCHSPQANTTEHFSEASAKPVNVAIIVRE